MSVYDGYIENGDGKAKNWWKIPKDCDGKQGLIYCKNIDKYVRSLVGKVKSVEAINGDFEGNPTYQLKITLESPNVNNIFTTGRNTFVGRDIINRLANIGGEIHYLMITPFISTADDGSTFTRCSIKHAKNLDLIVKEESKIKMKYTKDEIPSTKEVKVGNKKVIDSSERDDFYDNLIPQINARIHVPVISDEPTANDEEPF